MIFRGGLLLSVAAVFLQIAVFLQPLLPQQYQIAPVCETITRALLLPSSHQHHTTHTHHAEPHIQTHSTDTGHDHHDANHQCQYCTVYGNLVLPPELSVKEILDRIQVRLIAFEKAFQHVWFVLQQLFLIPQGRAPPLFA
ncbi:DUF2946 domain-containing protein [Acinetobacter sp. NCu2D-2]|uniref:DUF2946 family protein n=1 Tax=Acinetobacter sp. NCu2D-2 TaxID=1608473 RepID=UPI0007CDE629|nr:DUF2946 family protein [Acinetobacter sp. NCu2D-2]ANF83187.1 DUF2946 domain-containing protein [Acinetobacter sp. NCu2D-2]